MGIDYVYCQICNNCVIELDAIREIKLIKNNKKDNTEICKYINACVDCIYDNKKKFDKMTCHCGQTEECNDLPLDECKNKECDKNIGLVIRMKKNKKIIISDIIEKKF